MKTIFRRITGSLMIIAAIVSLLVSAIFLVGIWRLRQPVTARLVEILDLLYATTATMADSLSLVENTVISLTDASETISQSSLAIADTIDGAGNMTDSFARLLGDELTTTITDTQTAILSAQASAVVIDNILSGLASIPLLGFDYNPPVPLNQALGNISDTLSPIPTSLEQIQGDLESTSTNLLGLQEDLQLINLNLRNIVITLTEAQTVIDEYQQEIEALKTRLEHSRTAAPDWILIAAWLLTFVIAWLSISQLGLLLQGFDILLNTNNQAVNLSDQRAG
jgi:methyl-accepting chemotaxis protein